MITKVTNWLGRNSLGNLILAAIYFLTVVFSHAFIGRLINASFESFSRESYNRIISSVVIVSGIFIFISIYKNLKQHTEKNKLITFLFVTAILIILCFNILFVINIEAIHFVQYALFAMLIFPLTNSAQATMIYTLIAGAVDELYQYLYLDPNAFYFDFNDVLLNVIGGGIGLLFLKILGTYTILYNWSSFYKKLEWQLVGVILLALLIMFFTGDFSVNMNFDNPAFFTLFKEVPEGFWYYPIGPYAKYHILFPIPGLLLIMLIVFVYGQIDKISPIKAEQ